MADIGGYNKRVIFNRWLSMTFLLQFSAAPTGKKLEGSEMVDPPWTNWVRYLYVLYGQDAAMVLTVPY